MNILSPARILGKFRPIENNGLVTLAIASLALLGVRIWLAMPFWKSGWTKWSSFPFETNSTAKYLFEYEYKLHLGFTTLDMPFPHVTAHLASLGEVILPVLLVVGFFTRFSALGLLGMTFIIQLTYPSAFLIHGSWAIAAIILIYAGPGALSVDFGIRKLLGMK